MKKQQGTNETHSMLLSPPFFFFQKYHFAPTGKSNKSIATTATPPTTSSLYQRAQNLFRTVPVLYILCYEVLISQGVSTLISYMFITYTKQSIPLDNERASHTGKVYGRINGMSGILQFAILPYILGRPRRTGSDRSVIHQHSSVSNNNNNIQNGDPNQTDSNPPPPTTTATMHSRNRFVDWYWLLLPSVLGIAGMIMIILEPTSDIRFDVVTISFSTMKILEYSLRVALMERVRSI